MKQDGKCANLAAHVFKCAHLDVVVVIVVIVVFIVIIVVIV